MIRIVLITLLLAGCAGQPDKTTFADIAAKNQALSTPYPVRINMDIEADCFEGTCSLPESNLQALTDIITKLQDEVEARIDAGNELLTGALTHCEYANAKKDEAISFLESGMQKQELTSTIKQFASVLGCGALLWAK